jgi:hypothetical protein
VSQRTELGVAVRPPCPDGDEALRDLVVDRIFVAEVKSMTFSNEEKQLRLGLGSRFATARSSVGTAGRLSGCSQHIARMNLALHVHVVRPVHHHLCGLERASHSRPQAFTRRRH